MKKGIFIVSVLITSLITVQFIVMDSFFQKSEARKFENGTEIRPIEQVALPPKEIKDQFFIVDDYVVLIKDGKYYVVEKKIKAT